MNCPNCDNVLVKIERKNIEFEYCPDCGGFFLDADEWFLIKQIFELSGEIKNLMMINPISNFKDKPKKCPHCNNRMEKIDVNGIILDRCPHYHGVWFDKGELSDFINQNSDKKNEVISFLGETFNK